MYDTVEERIAHVQRELARLEAADEAMRLAPRSRRRLRGSSVVFSVRLDPDEVRALETRAALVGIKPSVLARNLIRLGLATRQADSLSRAVGQLEDALQDLRALVP
jgi:hypothetical protein